MITLNHIVYNIGQLAGKEKDDTYIEQLKFQVMYYRSLLFKRDYARTGNIPSALLQRIPCIPTEKVEKSECPITELQLEDTIYRTKYKLPQPIILGRRNAFQYVGTVDWSNAFNYVFPERIPYLLHAKYTSYSKRYFYLEGYIYLVNVEIDRIAVKGVFEDPTDLKNFTGCGTDTINPVYTDDSPYPITADLVQRVTQSILGGEARFNEPEHEVEK